MINFLFKLNRFLWTKDPTFLRWLPCYQSHRGYWVKGLQQNSLVSIGEAYKLNFDMVEFDVRMTCDKKVILFHDDTLFGKSISDSNFQDLHNILPFIANGQFFEQINLLEDVFKWYVENKIYVKMKLNIEIKSKNIIQSDLEYAVFKLIEKFKIENYVLISSFNPFSLYRFKKYNSKIFRALLLTLSSESNWVLNNLILNIFCRPHALHLRYDDFKYLYKKIPQFPIPIVLWVVNDDQLYDNLLKENIHGIITDQLLPSIKD